MKRISTLEITGLATCRHMHDHGLISVRFTFKKSNPLVVRMYVGDMFADLSRELLFHAICDGHLNECNVIGYDRITFKVPRSSPDLLSISWTVPPERVTDPGNDRYYVLVHRSTLYPWLQDTYAVMPKHGEFDELRIDDVIHQILESK